ncbi:hypothetical protein TraAM80_04701 [Trypanosoma rangeli]|uniref:Transmembrane protein n=1 Tax=Trypanosoma rangeli TaxID=5698 RepID=A0A422NIE2_TRYRA|nr:uncharacterized protein TraAM80_04701 [Trypanosoma rangeli]RNF05227.1 hypothetical protein TraAM80_04701 [Trypanosoma rangeli]|eukprot:RNF05227.1 hypothetical protein TraAM80_04701 [Trypanosoma rangeli]
MRERRQKERGGVCFTHSPQATSFPLAKALVLAAFLGLFVFVSCTIGRWPLPIAPSFAGGPELQRGKMDDAGLQQAMRRMEAILSNKPAPFLYPWGEERLVVLKEWTHIYCSIRMDVPLRAPLNDTGVEDKDSLASAPGEQLQILVYDANDGYMTLSIAKFLPESFVTSVALSSCLQVNGIRSACNSPQQVVAAMETRWNSMQETGAMMEKPRLLFCASSTMSLIWLGNMADSHIMADYQVAVSLFDRLPPSPTKRSFQRALISLLRSAKVATFITLPAFGAVGKRTRNAFHWYDQPQDPEQLMEEAGRLFFTKLSIIRLATFQHGNANRALFRVEVLWEKNLTAQEAVSLEVRRRLLRCDTPNRFV